MDASSIISIAVILSVICAAAFFQFPALVWTIFLAVTLITLNTMGYLSVSLSIVCWLTFLIVASFANLHVLRQRYFTAKLLPFMKKQMPPISNTEREAIEAGNTWWEKQLFNGRPQWRQLFSIPKPELSTEEQHFLDQQVDQLCSMLDDWQIIFNDRDLPKPVWDYLKKEKFFGMVIPKQYGGLGFSALAHSTVVTKIATRSISAAVNTMVPNSLGPAELLLHYGTEEQKNYYLPRLASGEEIPCFALTAPEAGSDAGSIPDLGVVCKGVHQGVETVGIRLSWDKRYITLAPVATVLGIAFRLYDPEHLLGEKEDIGITLCLIPASHPGVQIGTRHYPLHQAFMNGPTRGKEVFIPLDWIIGGTSMAGNGWRMLMECLSIGRAISLPALATACGKIAYKNTGPYARLRRQFNAPLSAFEGIEEALGYIAGFAYILESSRVMTASAVDLKIKPSIASAIAKYHMTELSRRSIAHAMDIHAGHGIQVGPRNFLANAHFAIPISITVEGANILTRNLIIFGQGAIRCHPYLLQEIELISAPSTNIKELDRVLMKHVGYFVGNFIRCLAYGLTGGRFIFATIKNRKIKRCERQLTRMSAALALLADTNLLLLGGSLKRRERISARLGDMLSQLYLASAVLKYFNDHGQPASDVDYVRWSIEYSLYEIQKASDELLNNFPVKWIGTFLSWVIFPFGRAYYAPKDQLHKNIVSPMLESSALRNRLTAFSYNSNDSTDTGNRLNRVLSQLNSVEPLLKKMQSAIKSGLIPPYRYDVTGRLQAALLAGVLTKEEVSQLNEFEALRNEIITVNEFSFDLTEVLV